MPRLIFILALTSTLVSATTVWAQAGETPTIDVSAGFSSQSSAVLAEGQHNMADSATLKAKGCEGYVATSPTIVVNYDAQGNQGALIVRASGADDLVLLIGTSSSKWYCASGAANAPPQIELPSGSGAFSVWVGTHTEGERSAILTVSEKSAPSTNTSCGGSDARIPEAISASDWSNYSCQSEADAQAVWSQCQPRTAYSTKPSDGCPGAQLCCPSLGEHDSDTVVVSDDSDDDNFYAEYSLPPIGNVAEGGPNQLIVETSPYGKTVEPIIVHWRGFSDAEIPVRATTTEDGKTVFTLRGENFPQAVDDSLLIIVQARTLRAKRDVDLGTKSEPARVSAGTKIELLGRIDRDTCALSIAGKQTTTTCPKAADFEGVERSFDGWSPLKYEWWVAVEDDDQQRGWLHIDRSKAEFSIELQAAPKE